MLETRGLLMGGLVGKVHLEKDGASAAGKLAVHLRALWDWRRPSQGQVWLTNHKLGFLLPVAVPLTGHLPFSSWCQVDKAQRVYRSQGFGFLADLVAFVAALLLVVVDFVAVVVAVAAAAAFVEFVAFALVAAAGDTVAAFAAVVVVVGFDAAEFGAVVAANVAAVIDGDVAAAVVAVVAAADAFVAAASVVAVGVAF